MSIYENSLELLIESLDDKIYWEPIKEITDLKINELQHERNITYEESLVISLDLLSQIMRNSEEGVNALIQRRIEDGIITDANQTRKVVAGNYFQYLIAYLLAKNVLAGNILEIFVAIKPRNHPLISNYLVIEANGTSQKPDVDILIYREEERSPINIISCKTSLRERAGQTYKWKLLLDLATCRCDHISNNEQCPVSYYDIQYELRRPILVSFVTADFYEEINQPQQIGTLSFFDYAYVTNNEIEINHNKANYLSSIINDLNNIYSEYTAD